MRLAILTAFLLVAAFACGGADADDHYERGLALAEERRWPEAVEAFNAAIVADPTQPDYYVQRGIADLWLGRYRLAEANFTRALEIAPNLHDAYRYRIAADMVLGNLDRAFADVGHLRALATPSP